MAFIRRRSGGLAFAASSAAGALAEAEALFIRTEPFDAERLLRLMGVRIEEGDIGSLSGVLERSAGVWTSRTNALQGRRRKILAMTHHLGHILLHGGTLRTPHEDVLRMRPHAFPSPLDEEATEFAFGLLMPERAVRAQAEQGRRTLTALAEHFGVPLDAMRFRAYRLNLIPAF